MESIDRKITFILARTEDNHLKKIMKIIEVFYKKVYKNY
jgi:hypothetical protein